MKKIPAFDVGDVDITDKQQRYKGFFTIKQLKLRHALFEGGQSDLFDRELCVRNDAVGILLYDPRLQQFALVEQIRIGALDRDESPWMLEVVAGMIDKDGESKQTVAIREAKEEANLEVQAVEPMLEYFVSPGGSTEKFSLFLGRVELTNVSGGVYGLKEEHEDIKLHVLPVSDVKALLAAGNINNAMTIIALQWFFLNKQDIDKRWC